MRQVSTFDLAIEKGRTWYRVRVLSEPLGWPKAKVSIHKTRRALGEHFPGLLEKIDGAVRLGRLPAQGEIAQIGEWLFATFFAGDVRAAWLRWVTSDSNLRLRILLDGVPELSNLPWEALYSAKGFVGLQEPMTILRSLPGGEAARPFEFKRPVRLAFLEGPAPAEAPLKADEEFKLLLEAVQRKGPGPQIRPQRFQLAPSQLASDPAGAISQIVHFSGHSAFDRTQGVGCSLVHTASGGRGTHFPHDWATDLARLSDLQLVVLNSCEGARHGTISAGTSLAEAIVRAGIPAVVAMQFPISNQAACDFTRAFYGALVEGFDVGVAVTRARQEIRDERPQEWLSPVLYLRGGPEAGPPDSVWDRIKAGIRTHPRLSAAALLGVLALSIAAPFREQIAERFWRVVHKVTFPEDHREMTLLSGPTIECPELPGTGIELVPIPAGEFRMGSDTGPEEERPAHPVRFTQPFCIGKTEVTQDQWKSFKGSNPSKQKGGDLPVTNVGWEEALDFTRKVNERFPGLSCSLPTEARFEYVAGAGEGLAYGVGETEDLAYSANCDADGLRDGYRRLAPVKAFFRNQWGVFGMPGNAGEWVLDRYGPYAEGLQVDPQGPPQGKGWETEKRVRRGGSYRNDPNKCRSTSRDSSEPNSRLPQLGFRIVCAPKRIAVPASAIGSSPPASP